MCHRDSVIISLKTKNKFNLSQLNPAQREAVEHIYGPVLILAGAGTGKTRTVISRLVNMLRQGVSSDSILAVTFTNKAANEMRERIRGMVSKESAKEMTVCTFHSLCVRILRKDIEKLGYKNNFTIYSSSDQVGLIRKLISRKSAKDESLDHNLAISLISRSKNKGVPVSDNNDSLVSEIERFYNKELKHLNAVDFDDLLILAVQVLKENEDVISFWRERFKYITVDEFQDTNKKQMELVQLLSGSDQNVCVVGDDDQSIYSWRGAEISNILEFERFFKSPKVITLEQNYRSNQAILHTANSSIINNTGRREKSLWSEKSSADNVRIIAMPGEDEEAQFVVDEILEMTATEKRSYDDISVLFRMNSQSRLFESKLREYKIPYRVIGGQSFFDRREIKDLLGYLLVIKNPDDDINLLRVINNPPRGIGNATIDIAVEKSRDLGCSLYNILIDGDFLLTIPPKSRSKVESFVSLMESYRSPMTSEYSSFGILFDQLVEEIGFTDFLQRNCKTDNEYQNRRNNVFEFISSLKDYEKRGKKNGMQDFLDDVALQQDRDEDDDSSLGVNLITLHAAKGLEFSDVYMVGVEEGMLPHKRSLEEGTRDEERRLFYVGMTRAMNRLTITYCASRKKYGELIRGEQSSFLEELDPTHIDVLSNEEAIGAPIDEGDAHAYFSRMKEMLGDD